MTIDLDSTICEVHGDHQQGAAYGDTHTLGYHPLLATRADSGEVLHARQLAAKVEPYIRADGTKIWSLMQLERQLQPEAYRRRRSGYLDHRRTRSGDASRP
jgi:hypothetical protein